MSDKSFYKAIVGVHKFYIDQRYQNLSPIGDGSYGIVASAYDTVTGRQVAIKKIKDTFIDIIDSKRILRELKLLRHFHGHENIIDLLDIMIHTNCYLPDGQIDIRGIDDIYIVTNLFESDLEKIIKSKQQLTDRHFQFFLYQLLRALKYVHSANVLHRDLKPSNILMNANCDLALCDFGLARGFDENADDTMTAYVVTRWYRAPELLCNTSSYGKALDIWSVGCIFAELLTHSPFFCGLNPQHQLQVIIHKIGCPPEREKLASVVSSPAALQQLLHYVNMYPQFQTDNCHSRFSSYFPSTVSPLALDLLQRMLTFLPNERITVEEALQHIYLKDFHQSSLLVSPDCLQPFDFEFEKFIQGDSAASKMAIQYLIYEEMRIFRPYHLPMQPPWISPLPMPTYATPTPRMFDMKRLKPKQAKDTLDDNSDDITLQNYHTTEISYHGGDDREYYRVASESKSHRK